ncbi:hypothetical protein F5Y15DRAFT_122 [Xylariaceae sp. FL0016]|nr:hypothetical protein F5Y15DRAFT_122 [Xylariaceae sp. FL0016]
MACCSILGTAIPAGLSIGDLAWWLLDALMQTSQLAYLPLGEEAWKEILLGCATTAVTMHNQSQETQQWLRYVVLCMHRRPISKVAYEVGRYISRSTRPALVTCPD